MYEAYWGLKEKPFQNTPDPRFFYLSPQHEDALMKLSYVMAEDMGCGMLTGTFGCGKTLLGRVLMQGLDKERHACVFINNPSGFEPAELFRAIVRGFSSQPLPETKDELSMDALVEKLNFTLYNNIRDGKKNIVFIDEAHTIVDERIFEQIRMILNFQLEDRFMLTLFLSGHPELKDKVEGMKALDQRVTIRCHLGPLREEEVGKYITHRLKVAGKEDIEHNPIFTPEAVKMIFQYSGGIPRRINVLCDLALMSSFAGKQKEVKSDLIDSIIKEFNLT